jgi:hypothetical protein
MSDSSCRLALAAALTLAITAGCGATSTPQAPLGASNTTGATAQLPTPVGVTEAGAPGPADGSSSGPACNLITKTDVAAALGQAVNDGISTTASNGTRSICIYVVSGGGPSGISVVLTPQGGKVAFDADRKLVGVVIPVSHIGDEAYATSDGLLMQAVKGNAEVGVNARLATSPPYKSAVATLIALAVSRL